MKKVFKIIISISASVLILITGLFFLVRDAFVKDFESTVYIGFSFEDPSEKEAELFPVEKILEYNSKYKQYNTYTYFLNLRGNEKTIYKVFEYALGNSYQYVLFDKDLLKDIEYSPIDILYFLSLDSPIVEQNLVNQTTDFSLTLDGILGAEKEISGTLFYIENFSKKKLDLKEKAIVRAQQIIDEMPSDLTASEKSEYFYCYLRDNVTYNDSYGTDYLYDALCNRQTQCDGFANAYSLLCNMTKIPCCEKVYFPSDGGTGHTWNCIKIDDVWFNVDATNNRTVAKLEKKNKFLARFCFSDELQADLPNYSNMLPKCSQNKYPVNCSFKTEKDKDFMSSVRKAFKNKKYILVTIKDKKLSQDKLQQICNNLYIDLRLVYIEGTNNNCYFLIKDD